MWLGGADGEWLRERGCKVTAADLHEAYQGQLRASLVPPWEQGLDPGGRRSMLQASVTLPAGDLDEPDDGRVLIWSDLHLGDWMGLGSFGRPFDSVREMDDARSMAPGGGRGRHGPGPG